MSDNCAAAAPELPDGEYAIVELLGHRMLVGRIAEIERFGTKLLQVEPIFRGRLLDPVYHHGSAIYGLTPCSKSVAAKRGPVHEYNLPTAIRCRMEPALPPPAASDETDAEDLEQADLDDGED